MVLSQQEKIGKLLSLQIELDPYEKKEVCRADFWRGAKKEVAKYMEQRSVKAIYYRKSSHLCLFSDLGLKMGTEAANTKGLARIEKGIVVDSFQMISTQPATQCFLELVNRSQERATCGLVLISD